jgi:Tol biopolymer transport system component
LKTSIKNSLRDRKLFFFLGAAILIIILIILIYFFLFKKDENLQADSIITKSVELEDGGSIALAVVNEKPRLERTDENGFTTKILEDKLFVSEFFLSPERDLIVYTTQDEDETLTLRIMNFDGKNKKELRNLDSRQAKASISFDSKKVAVTEPDKLGVIDLQNKEYIELITFDGSPTIENIFYVPDPFWSEDDVFVTIKTRGANWILDKYTKTFKVNIETKDVEVVSEGEDIPF